MSLYICAFVKVFVCRSSHKFARFILEESFKLICVCLDIIVYCGVDDYEKPQRQINKKNGSLINLCGDHYSNLSFKDLRSFTSDLNF